VVFFQGDLFDEKGGAAVAEDITPGVEHRPGLGLWNFKEGERDVLRALRTTKMDWDVEKRPLYYRDENKNEVVANDQAIVRIADNVQLGCASERYKCVQNTEAARLFEPLLETGKFTIDQAGVTTSNRVWITIRSDQEFDITGKGDQVVSRLIGSWKHDGGASVQFQYLPKRVVCSNMIQRMLDTTVRGGVAVRHYGNVGDAMNGVRGVFEMLRECEGEDIKAMMQLYKKPVTDIDSYFKGLLEKPDAAKYTSEASYKRAKTVYENILADMHRRYTGGMGLDLCARGNYWAAYGAVTETIDHYLGVTGKRKDYIDYAVFGQGARMRATAFDRAVAA
jgi:phage/plasmid-like protein (TIGR03299 family)